MPKINILDDQIHKYVFGEETTQSLYTDCLTYPDCYVHNCGINVLSDLLSYTFCIPNVQFNSPLKYVCYGNDLLIMMKSLRKFFKYMYINTLHTTITIHIEARA